MSEEKRKIQSKRIVSQGFLLYEYLPDDNRYVLVGIIDSALGGHGINPETGTATDEQEAEEFFKTGKINTKASFSDDES